MDPPAFAGEEIVTLGYRLFPHTTSKGYTPDPFSVVTHVNGTAVRNLVHSWWNCCATPRASS